MDPLATAVIEIIKSVGSFGVILLLMYIWLPKIGTAAQDACIWFGQQFLIPIRDALIGNINILTGFIMEMRALVPILKATSEQTMDMIERRNEKDNEIAMDNAKMRAHQRASMQVLSGQCPETATRCPFRQNGQDTPIT
jgi:hypothetical protein